VEAGPLLDSLLDLALEAGLEVRRAPRPRGDEPAPQSDTCRVRGRTWVVLSAADPLERQIDVLAAALRNEAGGLLAGRFLPPAVRLRIDGDG
jgi:hypothetical protein